MSVETYGFLCAGRLLIFVFVWDEDNPIGGRMSQNLVLLVWYGTLRVFIKLIVIKERKLIIVIYSSLSR